MYTFVVHWIDMNSDKNMSKTIEVDTYCMDDITERDAYLIAMGQAYDMMSDSDMFRSLELLSVG